MECDHHPHYFYDEMDSRFEDFFTLTAPSEDIWKKFELLPTPPVSPSRTLALNRTIFPSPAERGIWPLDEYIPFKLDPLDVIGNLSSVVIKDCMWSGGLSANKVNPRIETQNERELNVPRIQSPRAADVPPTRYVNPAAVLNLPSHQSKKTMTASSGSESRSDSSDADEIDVVTVDSRLKKQNRTPITIAVSADPHGPCKKYFHISLHRQQHNYAAPSPDSDMEHEERGEDHVSTPSRPELSSLSAPSSSSSSPASSDSEDSNGHRRNFLERKRRDNLRSRFQLLRNEIPGLMDTGKSSKVAVLTKATEYLLQLQATERWQIQERKKLCAKRQQLLRKISILKKC